MGRRYAIAFEGASITNANGTHDLFEITPADDKPVIVHSIVLSVTSELGDAEEEQLRLKIIRGHTSGGSGGVSPAPTPEPLDGNDAAAGLTAEAANSTLASGGTTADLHAESFNVRTGWIYMPTPECRPRVDQGDTSLVVRLMAAVTDDVTMSGTMIVEEL